MTWLSPYITHGFVSLPEVLAEVNARHALSVQHKLVFELGRREYFRHVWQHRGNGILRSLHEGPLPEDAYAEVLPADIREGCTGVPVIDQSVRTLYATGTLHNHARMWLASYVVHIRKVHWRAAADWLYGHLLDGDLASNHLSWQWVAGTGSRKPYLFNADNVARYAPADWYSPDTVIDTSYERLDVMARQPGKLPDATDPSPRAHRNANGEPLTQHAGSEPALTSLPPVELGLIAPDAASVKTRDVWLVHPWSLGELPADLPASTTVIGVFVADFHRAWPWSARRWRFVGQRMSELAAVRWFGSADEIEAALRGARNVRSVHEPHLAPWLPRWASCVAPPSLFPAVQRRCDSFSQWWTRSSKGLESAADLLALQEAPGW